MPENVAQTLASNLRKWMTKRGYKTIERFAYENGLHKGAVGLILKGRNLPRVDTLVKIAQALDVTLEDLYPLSPEKRKPPYLSRMERRIVDHAIKQVEELHATLKKVLKIHTTDL